MDTVPVVNSYFVRNALQHADHLRTYSAKEPNEHKDGGNIHLGISHICRYILFRSLGDQRRAMTQQRQAPDSPLRVPRNTNTNRHQPSRPRYRISRATQQRHRLLYVMCLRSIIGGVQHGTRIDPTAVHDGSCDYAIHWWRLSPYVTPRSHLVGK